MALQNNINLGIQSWSAIYTSITNPDLGSYDYNTLRQSMLNYLQTYNPESFNDYINSSEYISLVNLIAYLGAAASFRFDLNARESFLSTAQTRNAVISLANLINYVPSRNLCASGYLKINTISTNQNVLDSLGNNLNSITINWNDATNNNWMDQWNSILNAALIPSQSIGNPANTQIINGITTSEYGIGCASGQYPPYPFSATVDGSTMNFNLVNPTSVGEPYIYEVDPENVSGTYNLLYESDGLGYNSPNTGYFLYFKQGALNQQSFSIASSIPNYSITMNATGVNNTDVWLYNIGNNGIITQWTQVESVYGSTTGNVFSITSGDNDTITLVFGDGTFGNIPTGNFLCFTRSSNGLIYRINPSEMSNLTFTIPYNTSDNRTGQLTISASLQYTIGNSASTESLTDIKLKAPQSWYSQNRMVNGQDYNSFPFTQYSNILQVNAINRSSSGISRYLDVIDPTGKYSSTNSFCDDGFLYMDGSIITNNFTYQTPNNLAQILETQIANMIGGSSTLSFIINNYAPINPIQTTVWNMVTNDNTSSTGWFGDNGDLVVKIDDINFSNPTTGNVSILVPGAMLQFTPPSGYVFDNNNNLVIGNSSNPSINQKTVIYATVVGNPIQNGFGDSVEANGINVDGTGAVTLNALVPSGCTLTSIYPYFSATLPASIIQSLITFVTNGQSVGLYYNPYLIGFGQNACWTLAASPTFPLNYNPTTYGSTFVSPINSGASPTNSWILAFVPGANNTFIVYQRAISYYFGSQQETSFYFDPNEQIFNPTNATNLTDSIVILKTNPSPVASANTGLSNDIPVEIFGSVNEANGSVDNSRVQVQYSGLTSNGFPINPTFFTDCVGLNSQSYIFFVTNNIQNTTTIIPSGPYSVIVVDNPSVINNNLYSYANGTIIFSIATQGFYQISRIGSMASKSVLNNPGDTLTYSFYTGRQDLKFEYIHYASDNRRIDPTPSNLIDMYILEASYAIAYQQWLLDTTGQISEPAPPSTETLSNDYALLNNYKMVSDEIIFNPAQFVPLFGNKASPSLQANFVVVPNPNTPASSGEIASQVITQVNNFFAIGNFQFGQTFYSSQLVNYIMANLSSLVSAFTIVPIAPNLSYGSMEQITCNSYEIFTSAATVQNVVVTNSFNNLNLRIGSGA